MPNSNEYANILLEAMDMVMQKGMQNLKYDRTIQCVIKEIKNEKTGEYLVQYNNNPVFSAFSEIKYAVNDIVYVVIPEGDYNNQKFITGKVASILTLPEIINASKKSDLFLNIQNLLVPEPDTITTYHIQINDQTTDFAPLIYSNINVGSTKFDKLLITFKAWTPEGSAGFKGDWNKCNVVQGEYGLRIKIVGQIEESERLIEHEEINYFTCEDMTGNPYSYFYHEIAPLQKKLIDISMFRTIEFIAIEGYQDNNFIYVAEDDSFKAVEKNTLEALLLNISVSLGIAPSSIENNEVVLYTLDDLIYNHSSSSSASQSDTRTLNVAWMQTDKEGERTLIESQVPENYTVHWQMKKNNQWTTIQQDKNLQCGVIINSDVPEIKYRVKIKDEKIEYTSNILTFTNAINVDTLDQAIIENNRFSTVIGTQVQGTQDVVPYSGGERFFIYDKNGVILPQFKDHTFCIKVIDSKELLTTDNYTIEWSLSPIQDEQVKLESTMIIPKDESSNSDLFIFNIRNQLNGQYDHNTIYLTIKENNKIIYQTSIVLIFKQQDNYGSNFIVELQKNGEPITCLTEDMSLEEIIIQLKASADKVEKELILTQDMLKEGTVKNFKKITVEDNPVFQLLLPDGVPIEFSLPVVKEGYDISCLNRIEYNELGQPVLFDETECEIFKDMVRQAKEEYDIKMNTMLGYEAFLEQIREGKIDPKLHRLTATDKETGEIVASCAIVPAQHEYSSNSTNTWEGRPVINANNNALLQQVLAAGVRDCQGKYSGVMMGNGITGKEKIGLYGYSKNNKTFGLMIDGTGFIGPEGKGQIRFDGNSAKISNAANDCWINLNPGLSSMDGSFLYVATPQQSSEDAINFIQSYKTSLSGKDYFIVHPNYGIFTSGVVFSNGTVESADVAWLDFSEGEGTDAWAGSAHIGLVDDTPNFISLFQKEDTQNLVPLFTVDKKTGNVFLSDSGLISFNNKAKIWLNENNLTISKNFATINIRDEAVDIKYNNTTQLSVTSEGVIIDTLTANNIKVGSKTLEEYVQELIDKK